MGEGVESARTGYMIKVTLMYIFTLYDVMASAMGDHNDHSDIPGAALGIMGAQLGAVLLNCLTLFVLMFGTYLFQVGLIGVLFAEFKAILYILPTYFLVLGAHAGIKIKLLAIDKLSPVLLWDNGLFYLLSVVQKLVSLLYYIVVVRTTIKLGEPRLYEKSAWVAQYQAHTMT